MTYQQNHHPVLEVRNLITRVATPAGAKTVLDNVSFTLQAEETLCLAGESGSGKSVTALSIMGLLPPSARTTQGEILLEGRNLLDLSDRQMQKIRGGDIAMIFQEPMTSLNPVMTIGRQLKEAISIHQDVYGKEADAKALRALDAVRISESKRRMVQYPHELSGGMRQRVMIAMALSCNPKVLIADEPTTALDVTIQAQILTLMNELKKDFQTSIILITHDMGVVAEMADRVAVMNSGRIIEAQEVKKLFQAPSEAYTRALLKAIPRLGSMKDTPSEAKQLTPEGKPQTPVLEVRDLTVRFDINGGLLNRPVSRVHAVEKLSFDLFPGETLALVGESGCGKSTIGKSLVSLISAKGTIKIDGQEVTGLSAQELLPVRRKIQMVFQDPYAALDPRMTVGDLVGEPLVIHKLAHGRELIDRVENLFNRVGLPADAMARHPHEFSGGQRQRICIARALSLSPKIIVADESVSALDVSVQAQVLDLLQELQQELGLSYLFISHDMAVVEQVCHRVAVMLLGEIVECGPRDIVFSNPQHPYTKQLLDAVPIADPTVRRKERFLPQGEVPSPVRSLDYKPEIRSFNNLGQGHFVREYA
ncbi:ABC transporter ATP-binding protein [Kiloniella laminariae]|uniref:ABC transporter ATP-binding protein n=1 Tax=Kiloniella laminariae TaxID=454162 RepID=UPI0003699710|nr:ABC transporter ATP-binding protein [Kiloniella laminariae]